MNRNTTQHAARKYLKYFALAAIAPTAPILCGVCEAAPPAAADATRTPGPWRWGAKIDESPFAPGGKGVVIHAAPVAAAQADGSAAKPLGLEDAMRRAAETVRSMEAGYQRLSNGAPTLPLWLKITRRGDHLAAFSAPDAGGKPEAWAPAGEAKTVRLGQKVYAGLQVNSSKRWTKDGTFAAAAFDNVSLGVRPVADAAWQSTQIGNAYSSGQTVENGRITVRGNGDDNSGQNNWDDNGQFSYVEMPGDGDFVARLTSLTPSTDSGIVSAALVVRDSLFSGARMMELEASVKGDNSGLWRGFRADRATPGQDVKVVLAPGIYRSELRLPERDVAAHSRVFAVEGARSNGQTGNVIFSGSEEWKADTWKDEGNGVYSHPWTKNWGGKEIAARREMVFLTPAGGAMQRLSQVLGGEWKSAPGTFMVDEERDLLMLRLPQNWDAARWSAARIEVATREEHLLAFGTRNSRSDDNILLRNLVFQHNAGGGTVQMNWWPEPKAPARNWLLEDITIQHNAGEGFRLNHLRDFTLRRVRSIDNGGQNHFIGSEGQILDCAIDRNGLRKPTDTFWNALRNVYVWNSSFSDNTGNAFRNDHVAENLLIENCRFNGNSVQAITFETATGPITIRNSEVKNNNFAGGESDDSAVGLAMVHNFTLDGVTFENNRRSALMFYPRERAHVANEAGNDELPNTFDVGQWDTDNTPEGRWTPGGKKPGSENKNFLIRNCTFVSDAAEDTFIRQHYYRRGAAYIRNIRHELSAYNNRYFNPKNLRPFQLDNVSWKPDPGDKFATFTEWQKQSALPNFEAGSGWGQSAPRNFKPAPLKLATPGKSAKPQVLGGQLIYEVERLPFKASQPVEVLAASGAQVHKLHADQVGDYGDSVTYTLDVPRTGDYWVDVRYWQDAGAWKYLGYAQLQIDGKVQGDWWDQHGLTPALMTHQLGRVRLTQGVHTFRFESVWRNGYGSGDYDITVDRIALRNTLDALPAAPNAPAQDGLRYQVFEGGDWTRLPDFSKLSPIDSGQTNTFGIDVAGEAEKFGLRFTGSLEVPRDGIYTFASTVNDGANLYIGDALVVDNDGVHDGEKDEPWQKRGNVALRAGRHPIRVDYFESGGKGKGLKVLWAPLGDSLRPISPRELGSKNLVVAPVPVGPSLLNGNTAQLAAFKKRFKGNASLQESGAWPQPWSANLWDENSTGEIALEPDPVTKRNAIVLRNLEGKPSLQFYTWKNIDLPPGRYEMRFDYMTGGDAGGEAFLNFKDRDDRKVRIELPASQGAWKRISHVIEAAEALAISPQFRVGGMGADKALYLSNISLRRLSEAAPTP